MKEVLRDLTILTVIIGFVVGASAQQAQPSTRVEGKIISVSATVGGSLATFNLKTADGKEYMIHLGRLSNAAGELFTPKVGETITVSGQLIGGTGGQGMLMLHAAEIGSGGQTFTASTGPGPGPATGPAQGMQGMGGMMGQGGGMQGMVGHGMMGQGGMQGMMQGQGTGQPGQGMQGMACGCPCMSGQSMQGQAMPGHQMPAQPQQQGTGPMCQGCQMMHQGAPAQAPPPQSH